MCLIYDNSNNINTEYTNTQNICIKKNNNAGEPNGLYFIILYYPVLILLLLSKIKLETHTGLIFRGEVVLNLKTVSISEGVPSGTICLQI